MAKNPVARCWNWVGQFTGHPPFGRLAENRCEGGVWIIERRASRCLSRVFALARLEKSNMVLHYSDALLQTQDPNGGKFGDWVTKKDSFNVSCRLCKNYICIKEGEHALSKQ